MDKILRNNYKILIEDDLINHIVVAFVCPNITYEFLFIVFFKYKIINYHSLLLLYTLIPLGHTNQSFHSDYVTHIGKVCWEMWDLYSCVT